MALTKLARIASGTEISIVAWNRVEQVDTPRIRVAGVRRAHILIVTVQKTTLDALASLAVVTHGARITVVAIGLVGDMDTKSLLVAAIIGTRIPVVTIYRRTRLARPVYALVVEGTRITVVARSRCCHVDTSQGRIAAVLGARVVVIAIEGAIELATPHEALVSGGAGVAVIASRLVLGVDTTVFGMARIVGADVVVVANECITALAPE